LARAQEAAEHGCGPSQNHDAVVIEELENLAASCAPVVDAIQPCHDLLSMRLFRT
jgi:hypothetical protein